MVYCTHCGIKNDEDAAYCMKCGKPLSDQTQAVRRDECEECFQGGGILLRIIIGLFLLFIGIAIILAIFSISLFICWWVIPLVIAVFAIAFGLRALGKK